MNRARRPTPATIPMPQPLMREIIAADPDGSYARARVAQYIEQNKEQKRVR